MLQAKAVSQSLLDCSELLPLLMALFRLLTWMEVLELAFDWSLRNCMMSLESKSRSYYVGTGSSFLLFVGSVELKA